MEAVRLLSAVGASGDLVNGADLSMAVSTQLCIAANQGTLGSVGLAHLQRKHCAVDHVGLFGPSVPNYFNPYSLAYAVLTDQPGPQAEGSAVLKPTAMKHLAVVNCTCIAFWHFPAPMF